MHKASKTAVLINNSGPPSGCLDRHPQGWRDPPLSQTRFRRHSQDDRTTTEWPCLPHLQRQAITEASGAWGPVQGASTRTPVLPVQDEAIAPAAPHCHATVQGWPAQRQKPRGHAWSVCGGLAGARQQQTPASRFGGVPPPARPDKTSQAGWIRPRPGQSGRGSSCTCLPLKPGPAARPPARARPPPAPWCGTDPPAPGSPPRCPCHR